MDEKKDLRYDGYVNLLTKAGTWKDSTEAYTYQFEDPTPDADLAQIYSTNGLFTRIIDKPAELAFRYGYNLGMSDSDIEGRVTKQLERLKWKANGSLALKWARLFGGPAILLGVDDGMDWEEPIDEDNVRSVENLVVFERPEIHPDYLSTIYRKISPKNMDQFGQPEYYYITPVYGGQQIRVHESRLLIFKNRQLPRTSTMSTDYMFFGSPEYNRIKRELRDTVTTHGNGYRMLERCVQAVYKMKNLSALLATEEGEDDVLKRIELVDMARSLLNTMVIDGDGEEFQFQSFSLPGIRDIIDESCNMLSAVTNIPQTILFGRSPAGENATGESDLTNYYDYVGLIQEMNVTDNLTKLVKLILRGYANTGKIEDIPSFELEANPLWNMSEMEKAQLDQAQASAAATKASTAATYIQLQVLDPREVRKSLAESDEFKIDDVISEDDLVSDEEWEKMMQQSQQQGAQPGQQPQQPAAQPVQPQQPIPQMQQKDGRTHNDGGPGSGNFGHEGRPGKIGGSAPKESGKGKVEVDYDEFVDEDEGVGAVHDKSTGEVLFVPAYSGSTSASNGMYDIDTEVLDKKKTEFTQYNLDHELGGVADDDEVHDAIESVREYGTGGDCQMILSAQSPGMYGYIESGMTEEQKEWAKKAADNIETFIEKSEKYDGPIYRGVSLNDSINDGVEEYISSLKEGETIDMGHISSWTSNVGTARSYSVGAVDAEIEEGENYSVVFSCNSNKSAVSLRGINPEGECLAPSSAKYKITGVKYSYDDELECHMYVVETEEV